MRVKQRVGDLNLCQFMLQCTNLILRYSERTRAKREKKLGIEYLWMKMKMCSHTYETDTLKALGCVLLSFFLWRNSKKGFVERISCSLLTYLSQLFCSYFDLRNEHENLIFFSLNTAACNDIKTKFYTYFWSNISWLESHKCTNKIEWGKLLGIQRLCQVSNSTRAVLHMVETHEWHKRISNGIAKREERNI